MAVCATLALPALALAVHADAPILALPNTFLDFGANNLYIAAVMLLDRAAFLSRYCPFELQSASIACEVARESKFLALDVGLGAATGE